MNPTASHPPLPPAAVRPRRACTRAAAAPGAALLSLLLLLLCGALVASAPASAEEDILSPQEAFRYTVEADGERLLVRWDIERGYYMYRDRMRYSSDSAGVTLGEPSFSKGKVKDDEFFGKVEIYRDHAQVSIPYTRTPGSDAAVELSIRSQGCADIGLCYPPETWIATVSLPAAPTGEASSARAAAPAGAGVDPLGAVFGGAGGGVAVSGEDFLPVEQAFAFRAEIVDAFTVRAVWDIAEGYYLYRDKLAFTSSAASVELQQPQLPPGEAEEDEYFGEVRVLRGVAQVLIPVSRTTRDPVEFTLGARFQGCAEDGICYPPASAETLILLPAVGDGAGPVMASTGGAAGTPVGPGAPVSEQNLLADTIVNGNLLYVVGLFFGVGALLAFTPCVFPMFPILSGIIIGQQRQGGDGAGDTRRAFVLSLTYVLAMAGAYTVAGVLTAMAGQNLQAAFQHPAVLTVFSLLFVALALSMFGLYELQMPTAIQNRLTAISNRQQGGSLTGVAIMGVLSALIVGPCVAAPLAAALIVIGQGGDPVRGGLALFCLGLGMGAPLVAYGTSAGRLLPRAGAWMERVKLFFGLTMLAVAIWMISRIVPAWTSMALWAALGIGGGLALGGFPPFARVAGASATPLPVRLAGAAATAWGVVIAAGLASGGTDPLAPFQRHDAVDHLDFQRIASVAELEGAVVAAAGEGRIVMLDFYADWCTSCKEMEKHTFTDARVQAALDGAVLLQADVTANNADDRALLDYFGIYGPPTIAFFGPDGTELRSSRVVGFMPAERFEAHVNAVVDATAAGTTRMSAAETPPPR